MIIYSPTDGDAFTTSIPSAPKRCFLMTRLGMPVPEMVKAMRIDITNCCEKIGYRVVDAATHITGRDFLIKIWKQIAASPLAVGIVHEDIPASTQANIYYELGVAQALGKETVIVKSPKAKVPSDFIRTEYIEFNRKFKSSFSRYLVALYNQAEHYELVAEQLDRNPILAIDYLRRAYLITGDKKFQTKARTILKDAGIENRAKNSVELLAATF